MSASCRHANHEALCEACAAEDEYLDAVAQRWQEPLRTWNETGRWPGAKGASMVSATVTEEDWHEAARVMARCVRGSGYIPERHEQKLLNRARRADPERYRELHASIKGQAVRELSLQPEKE